MSSRETSRKINDLIQRLTELRLLREEICLEEDSIHTELLFLSSEHETVERKPAAKDKVSSEGNKRRDREGNLIEIGDTVKSLTPTKFKGTKGIVSNFSPSRVTSITKDKRKVSKASRNLSIIKKHNASSASKDSPDVVQSNQED